MSQSEIGSILPASRSKNQYPILLANRNFKSTSIDGYRLPVNANHTNGCTPKLPHTTELMATSHPVRLDNFIPMSASPFASHLPAPQPQLIDFQQLPIQGIIGDSLVSAMNAWSHPLTMASTSQYDVSMNDPYNACTVLKTDTNVTVESRSPSPQVLPDPHIDKYPTQSMLPPSFQKQTVFDLAMHTIPEQRQTATSGYMLFCNDHRSQMTDLQSTPSLDMKQWLDERWNALSQTHKKKYHQRAIIINSQMEEGDELDLYTSDNDSDNSLPLKRSYEDTCIPSHKYPVLGPTHIVSPEAIREAEEEEKEEAMGISRCRAFSAFPSFLSLKNMHERAQQQKKQRLEQDPMAADSHAIHVRSFSHSHSPPSVSIPMFSPTISHSSATDSPRLSDAYHSDEETFPLSPPEIATCSPPSATSRIQHEPRIKIEASTSVQPLFRQNNANYQTKEKTRLKRPPNAYLLFNRDMRRELLKISPKLTVAEISKEVGDRWRILSKEKRQSYNEEAMKLKEQHIRDHPDFIYTRRSKAELAEARRFSRAGRKASTSVPSADGIDVNIMSLPKGLKSDDPKRQCKNTATGPNDTRRDPRGRKKKRHRHPSAPKHPMSGFLFFLAAVRPEVARQFPGCTVGPISKAISDRWRALSEEERTPWLQKAEQDKARYAHEMRLYLANLEPQEPGNASAVETTVDDHTLMASVPHAANGAGDQTQLASFPGIT